MSKKGNMQGYSGIGDEMRTRRGRGEDEDEDKGEGEDKDKDKDKGEVGSMTRMRMWRRRGR